MFDICCLIKSSGLFLGLEIWNMNIYFGGKSLGLFIFIFRRKGVVGVLKFSGIGIFRSYFF